MKVTKRKPGGVYLIRRKDLYKIGLSRQVLSRFDGLYSDLGETLHLVNFIKAEPIEIVEKYLHNRYKIYHSNGEWFRLPYSIVEELMFTQSITYSFMNKTFTHIRIPPFKEEVLSI